MLVVVRGAIASKRARSAAEKRAEEEEEGAKDKRETHLNLIEI